ncbi:MAG: ankyrin repeat domain-containing protein [Bryobacteraceae bacterium]|nr:ankyrin repeat domain-containing protein [Bryobacteraceae bacterium]
MRWLLIFIAAAGLHAADALHRAVYEEDAAAVERLVREGADVKAANPYGATPLSLACANGNAPIVRLLLAAGADPNETLPGGETALMTASRTGNLEIVRALLKGGAKVNAAEERRGQTALMWAASEGHAAVVEALVEAGADVAASLPSGYTAFLFAVREGHLAAAQALLKAGARINDPVQPRQAPGPRPASGAGAPRAGTTALHLATANAHFELGLRLLEAGADPNALGPGYAPLHMIPTVRKPGGGDNDPAPDGSGSMTALEFVRKLVAHGADVNLRMTRRIGFGLSSLNTHGATPFLLAARTADVPLMRLLVELGADPKVPNIDGATPLIVAAGLGTRSPGEDAGSEPEVLEAVQLALDLGNDINGVDRNGETAMHGAAYKNLPKVVELLAANGADSAVWNRPNKQGWTPLTIAEGHRFGNFKPSPVTVAAFHAVMRRAGLAIPPPFQPGRLANSDYRPPSPGPAKK